MYCFYSFHSTILFFSIRLMRIPSEPGSEGVFLHCLGWAFLKISGLVGVGDISRMGYVRNH